MILSFIWYAAAGRKYYSGPRSNLSEEEKRELEH
jgi:hypothetical protein